MISFALSTALLLLSADKPVEIIAHRGESADAPENTLAAFQLAWIGKCRPLNWTCISHRMASWFAATMPIQSATAGVAKRIGLTSASELLDLDVGSWKDAKFANERLPTLEAALATIPEAGRCFIEVKVGPESVPALEKAVLESKKSPGQLAVISFRAETIASAKERMPTLKMYYLSGFKKDKSTGRWLTNIADIIATAKRIKADGVDLAWDGPWDESAVQQIRDAGMEFYVGTIDDPAVAKQFVKWGVDGITTNKAAWLQDALKR